MLLPAPARESAAFAPTRPCPRERSLCFYPPLPEGAQPLPLAAPARESGAFSPVLSYSDISVIDKTTCFCCRLLWVSFYVVSLLFLLCDILESLKSSLTFLTSGKVWLNVTKVLYFTSRPLRSSFRCKTVEF